MYFWKKLSVVWAIRASGCSFFFLPPGEEGGSKEIVPQSSVQRKKETTQTTNHAFVFLYPPSRCMLKQMPASSPRPHSHTLDTLH
jgi:hypothetical protein